MSILSIRKAFAAGWMAFGFIAAAQGHTPKIPLKVLYAGIEKDVRTPGVMEFLKEHFKQAGFAPYTEFKPQMADGYNVIVFDAPWMPEKDRGPMPQGPRLSQDFDRASVLVGTGGAMIAKDLNLKLEWLCTCLEGPAHNVQLDHLIFKTPFPVDVQLKDAPTPQWYEHWVPPHSLPATIPAWKVQQVESTDKPRVVGPGVILMGKGFLDSPDCEKISGGMNMKDIDGVAIGRQGSFFYWGFQASPAQMTPSGRKAFLNSIVYAAKFDHAPVLVRNISRPREWVIAEINSILNIRTEYDTQVSIRSSWAQRIAELKKKAETQALTPQEQHDAQLPLRVVPPFDEYRRKSIEEKFPAEMLKQTGMDMEKIQAFYKTNYPYLMPTSRAKDRPLQYEVDEDAKALGIGNSDVRLLDTCVDLLARGKDTDRALRLLRRYTSVDFATPQEWQAWLKEHRAHLFFSDYGGYRFYSDQPGKTSAPVTQTSAPRATQANPAVFSAAGAVSGDVLTLTVDVALAEGWHIYAAVPSNSPYVVTTLDAKLPQGASFIGDWSQPPVRALEEGTFIIEENQAFSRKVKLSPDLKGSLSIPVRISWQACNSERCLPPESRTFVVEVKQQPQEG